MRDHARNQEMKMRSKSREQDKTMQSSTDEDASGKEQAVRPAKRREKKIKTCSYGQKRKIKKRCMTHRCHFVQQQKKKVHLLWGSLGEHLFPVVVQSHRRGTVSKIEQAQL